MRKVTLSFGVLFLTCIRVMAAECYESSVVSPTPFLGNDGEIFKLADGSVWEVKYEYEYLYEYYPTVLACPSRGKIFIDGDSLSVNRISTGRAVAGSNTGKSTDSSTWEIYEETNLQGSISGTVEIGRIFKTVSGNVYEVTGLTLQLVLELQPDVMVLRQGDTYKLVVDGFDEPLICKKLN